MRIFKSNRKGEGATTPSFQAIIGIVLAALMILASFVFWNLIVGWLLGTQIDQYTVASFNSLTKEINEMSAPAGKDENGNPLPDTRLAQKLIPYYINNDYVLIGFSERRNFVRETCASHSDVQKPSSCRSSACLCICERGDLCKKPRKTMCKEFPDIIEEIWIKPESPAPSMGAVSPDNSQYKYLVVYGKDCNFLGLGGHSFQTREMIVDRTTVSDTKSDIVFSFTDATKN